MAETSPSQLGTASIARLLEQCHVRRVPTKSEVLSAGSMPESLYFIIEGSVTVTAEDEDGNEIVVAYLNRGEFFGELGLFAASTRGTWVRTRSECLLGEIGYARFRELARRDPDLLFELARQLTMRLQRTTRKISDLAFLDVTGRIARTLLDLCHQPDAMTHPEGMQIRVSRQELGRIAGCSREMAGKVLKSLEEQALIAVSGKTIVVFGLRPDSDKTIPLTRRFRQFRHG